MTTTTFPGPVVDQTYTFDPALFASVELHLGTRPLERKHAAAITALRGQYSKRPDYKRFVTLPLSEEGIKLAAELVREYCPYTKSVTTIFRGGVCSRLNAGHVVHYLSIRLWEEQLRRQAEVLAARARAELERQEEADRQRSAEQALRRELERQAFQLRILEAIPEGFAHMSAAELAAVLADALS